MIRVAGEAADDAGVAREPVGEAGVSSAFDNGDLMGLAEAEGPASHGRADFEKVGISYGKFSTGGGGIEDEGAIEIRNGEVGSDFEGGASEGDVVDAEADVVLAGRVEGSAEVGGFESEAQGLVRVGGEG